MKAIQTYRRWQRLYLGFDILPYQISLGVTLRVFEGAVHFRIYAGPFKALGGFYFALQQPMHKAHGGEA